MNLRISSITITGALINNTAFHSSQLRGVIENNSYDTISVYIERELREQETHREERDIKDHEV